MNYSLKSTTAMGAMIACMAMPAFADMEAAREFLDNEIAGLSVLDRAAQEAEMQFFVDAAAPFQGMEIKVVSEMITTHEYESQLLAPAFTAAAKSASSRMIFGDLPPSSWATLFTVGAAFWATSTPARVEPVNDTMSISGCELNAVPTPGPSPLIML